MADEGERRLAAILSADVAGYSKLMGDDERATVLTLTDYREVFADHIARHKGRLVDSPGDNLLAEFASPVEALNAAVDIQHDLASRNRQLAEHRQMHFRIGLNLGDVITKKDGTIYGDGVNIAARLEGMAKPGGICLSETVYFQVEGKVNAAFEDIGAHGVKNIAKPVRTYRVVSDAATFAAKRPTSARTRSVVIPAAVVALVVAGLAVWQYTQSPDQAAIDEDTVFALPTGPSIAVLPFENMSGDPEQEYFSDGITETLITDLSKIPSLLVIARNSTFRYKGQSPDMRRVGRELGVRHVLEGSVQRSGESLRINVQLIDATTGAHVWAERYDRKAADIFAVQDDITRRIVTEMDVQLVAGEQARVFRNTTNNVEAYSLYLKARTAHHSFVKEDILRARNNYQRALGLDPNFTMALVWLAWTHHVAVDGGWSDDPGQSLNKSLEIAKKALELDPSLSDAHAIVGETYIRQREFDKALLEFDKALELGINNAESLLLISWNYTFLGKPREGLVLARKALQMNPFPPAWHWGGLGDALAFNGSYEEAIPNYHKCADEVPDFLWCQAGLTVAYVKTGQIEKAQMHAKELVRVNPKFTAESNEYVLQMKDIARRDRTIAALRKAGLP